MRGIDKMTIRKSPMTIRDIHIIEQYAQILTSRTSGRASLCYSNRIFQRSEGEHLRAHFVTSQDAHILTECIHVLLKTKILDTSYGCV